MQTLGETKRWSADDASVVGLGCWVPDVPPHFVRRERLEPAERCRGVAVDGGNGHGRRRKIGAAGRLGLGGFEAGTTAWLQLDPVDNEPVRFWPRLVRALQVVDPDVGDNVMAALSAGVSDSLLAEVLVGELAVVRPLVVVLDDLHRLTRPELIHAIAYIAGHLPPHVHLIVTTRQPCGLGLHRLRMSGDLAEIDQDDLRFNDDEAGPLLSVVAARPISSSDIEVLTARTEGWAAGLCLAGLILAEEKDVRRSVASFQGDSPLVAEYFQDEVLIDLPRDGPVHDDFRAGRDNDRPVSRGNRPPRCRRHPRGSGRPQPAHAPDRRRGPLVSLPRALRRLPAPSPGRTRPRRGPSSPGAGRRLVAAQRPPPRCVRAACARPRLRPGPGGGGGRGGTPGRPRPTHRR